MSEYKKKLIEVALPLEAINKESAREKSIRHGHPSTLHLWWSRKPLSTSRAVLFASLVDDPSSNLDKFPTEETQTAERERLFKVIEDLVKWENSNNEKVLAAARAEILNSTDGKPPAVLDPFCGGGSIPLEAQRLGLEAHGSDLNPVAVLITKALIEIPPKFAGRAPVHPNEGKLAVKQWKGAEGLAEDVRHYGEWMREEAFKRIGHLYPKVKLSAEQGGGEATVIAWLWVRTVTCPNPVCGIQMPLASKFALSTKKGKQAWVEPELDSSAKRMKFTVKTGAGKIPEGTVNRKGAVCIGCKTPVPFDYVRSEAKAGRMNAQLIAVVAEGTKGRVYCSPTAEHEKAAQISIPKDIPDTDLPEQALGFRVQAYGMVKHAHLFTNRQLVALTTFSDLVSEARKKVLKDAIAAGMPTDALKGALSTGAQGYANAVATYLALAVSKVADYNSIICSWHAGRDTIRNTFARQAIPMVWDYAEANPLSDSTGNFLGAVDWIAAVLKRMPEHLPQGFVQQNDIVLMSPVDPGIIVSTDPPYYDNIGYADLSDYFYVWLRRILLPIEHGLFATVLVPKGPELVATPYRFKGGKEEAQQFFESGFLKAFHNLKALQNPNYPLTVYYAFKQSEADEDSDEDESSSGNNRASTGWETMLEGLMQSGFSVMGTWPMRTELSNRSVAKDTNALASSIVLVCRPRRQTAQKTTRRSFIADLKKELPESLRQLQHGYIAPVDLAQAAIGPGMAIFSRYSEVLEADGKRMPVRTALQLINQVLDEVLLEQDSDYDADTRWAVSWFEQFGFNEGQFGDAELLSKAKDTALDGLVASGIVQSKSGKVRLLRSYELAEGWNPDTDKRLTVWEITHYLSRYLEEGGIDKAAPLMKQLGSRAESGQELAYRLFGICEKKKWSEFALAYNNLVVAWPDIKQAASNLQGEPKQLALEV